MSRIPLWDVFIPSYYILSKFVPNQSHSQKIYVHLNSFSKYMINQEMTEKNCVHTNWCLSKLCTHKPIPTKYDTIINKLLKPFPTMRLLKSKFNKYVHTQALVRTQPMKLVLNHSKCLSTRSIFASTEA